MEPAGNPRGKVDDDQPRHARAARRHGGARSLSVSGWRQNDACFGAWVGTKRSIGGGQGGDTAPVLIAALRQARQPLGLGTQNFCCLLFLRTSWNVTCRPAIRGKRRQPQEHCSAPAGAPIGIKGSLCYYYSRWVEKLFFFRNDVHGADTRLN